MSSHLSLENLLPEKAHIEEVMPNRTKFKVRNGLLGFPSIYWNGNVVEVKVARGLQQLPQKKDEVVIVRGVNEGKEIVSRIFFKEEIKEAYGAVYFVDAETALVQPDNNLPVKVYIQRKVFSQRRKVVNALDVVLEKGSRVYFHAVQMSPDYMSAFYAVSEDEYVKVISSSSLPSSNQETSKVINSIPWEEKTNLLGIIVEVEPVHGMIWCKELGKVAFKNQDTYPEPPKKLTIDHVHGKWVRFNAIPRDNWYRNNKGASWSAKRVRLYENNGRPVQPLLEFDRQESNEFQVYGKAMVGNLQNGKGMLWSEEIGRIICGEFTDDLETVKSLDVVRFVAEYWKDSDQLHAHWLATKVELIEHVESLEKWNRGSNSTTEKLILRIVESHRDFAILKPEDYAIAGDGNVYMDKKDFATTDSELSFRKQVRSFTTFTGVVVPCPNIHSCDRRALLVYPNEPVESSPASNEIKICEDSLHGPSGSSAQPAEEEVVIGESAADTWKEEEDGQEDKNELDDYLPDEMSSDRTSSNVPPERKSSVGDLIDLDRNLDQQERLQDSPYSVVASDPFSVEQNADSWTILGKNTGISQSIDGIGNIKLLPDGFDIGRNEKVIEWFDKKSADVKDAETQTTMLLEREIMMKVCADPEMWTLLCQKMPLISLDVLKAQRF